MTTAVRKAIPWVLIVALLLLAWPARWGGWFGWTLVAGDSMVPTLQSGDVVFTMRSAGYESGDIIVYEPDDLPGRLIIHRVIAPYEDGTFQTQGDNTEGPDQWYPTEDDIQGRVLLTLPRCESAVCAGLGWPMVLFTMMLAVAGSMLAFEWVRNGFRPGRMVVRRPTIPLEGERTWTLADPPPGMVPQDVAPGQIRAAMNLGEMVAVYEPWHTIRTGEVAGLMAHVRWQHPRLGLLGSDLFLPVPDDPETDRDVDLWTLRETVSQLSKFDGASPALMVRVPHGALQDVAGLVDLVSTTCAEHGFPLDRLILGISDQVFIADSRARFRLTGDLVDLGVRVCLHHGPEPDPAILARVAESPVSDVTLDMSVLQLPAEPDRSALSRAISRMSDDIYVTGRNVTSIEQVQALKEHGVLAYLGPLYGPPVRWETMEKSLRGGSEPVKLEQMWQG